MNPKYKISEDGIHKIESGNALRCGKTGRLIAIFCNAHDLNELIDNVQNKNIGSTTYRLKILPKCFKAIKDGYKTFEILDNSDRGVQKGDFVILQEYTPENKSKEFVYYTGKEITVEITYITNYEQKENYIVFGFVLTAK